MSASALTAGEAPAGAALRLYQVFANVEGLRVRTRAALLGFIPLPRCRSFGFYVVMTVAAPPACKPAALLHVTKATLAEEFAAFSRTSPGTWRVEAVSWRDIGAAPPILREPACTDQDWGAVWYEIGDQAAKRDRYRLAEARLWHNGAGETAPLHEATAPRLV